MQPDSTFTYLDELMDSLSACIVEGSRKVRLSAGQAEVNMELMAIAHLQTTVAAHVLVLARKLVDLPCEIREDVMNSTGIALEEAQEILGIGENITCSDALNTAAVCLQTVMQCMEQTATGPGEAS
jgi:hypothetical protein